jgi:hypothetical protein
MIRPHRVINDRYLLRWHIIPRNRWFNVYLHKFLGDDDDRALHDHPWHSLSVCLGGDGRLLEVLPGKRVRSIKRWRPYFRKADQAHRLALIGNHCWTLFITGPRIREWGFLCPQGWRHWEEFTDATGDRVGRGCD